MAKRTKTVQVHMWVCDNCGAVHEGNVIMRVVKGDITGCAQCIRPDQKVIDDVWEQILIPAVDRQLREKFGLSAADLPWEIVLVLGRWLLGGPRRTLDEELRELGVTASAEELIREHEQRRKAAVQTRNVKASQRTPKTTRSSRG